MDALNASEARIVMAKVQDKMHEMVQDRVKEMVYVQLNAAGFDQNLSAADLTMRRLAMATPSDSRPLMYAGAAGFGASHPETSQTLQSECGATDTTKTERREERFWTARRSLRLWPIKDGSKESLEEYMKENLD